MVYTTMITRLLRNIFTLMNHIPHKYVLSKYPPRYGLESFLRMAPKRARVLDVGCGNDSPRRIKTLAPDIHYTGIDVSDYNQHSQSLADAYFITTPHAFADTIYHLPDTFDIVIWNHNIEHCNYPYRVLLSIIFRMARGARLYIAMPCAASVTFPSRRGTLNYYDDWTHQHLPPDIAQITAVMNSYGLRILVNQHRYRPKLWAAIGLIQEPFSAAHKKVYGGTWALYGFETVLWATKS